MQIEDGSSGDRGGGQIMFGPLDNVFDFGKDGKLDAWERAAELEFVHEKMRDAGLDYDELEMMDPDERREALLDAGFDPDDPDEYDF